jgi:uncharacterized protein YecT (DUF1311 family)
MHVIKVGLCMLVFVSFLFAQQCKNTDQELNDVYNLILTKYKSDTLFISKLKTAQRAWIKYRDAHIESHFPLNAKSDPFVNYGSMYSTCICFDLETMTRERIKHLKVWLDGYEEGDVCQGSVKRKEN